MSMTLHKLGRDEIIRELTWIMAKGTWTSSEIAMYPRGGKKSVIVAVREKPDGVYLYHLEQDFSTVLAMAPYMGSDMKVMDVKEVLNALLACKADDVWLQWPDDGKDPHTVIGKIFGYVENGTLRVCLIPAPKDIEEINVRVRERVLEECPVARAEIECGDCFFLPSCGILGKIDKEITDEEEKRVRD